MSLDHDAVTVADNPALSRFVVPRCPFVRSHLEKHPEPTEVTDK